MFLLSHQATSTNLTVWFTDWPFQSYNSKIESLYQSVSVTTRRITTCVRRSSSSNIVTNVENNQQVIDSKVLKSLLTRSTEHKTAELVECKDKNCDYRQNGHWGYSETSQIELVKNPSCVCRIPGDHAAGRLVSLPTVWLFTEAHEETWVYTRIHNQQSLGDIIHGHAARRTVRLGVKPVKELLLDSTGWRQRLRLGELEVSSPTHIVKSSAQC